MTEEEPKEAAPHVVEKKAGEPSHDQATPEDEKDAKPKSEPTSDDEAFAEAMNKQFDAEDAIKGEVALWIREKGYLHGPKFPAKLEMDPESLEMIVDGVRESELSTTKTVAADLG